MITSFILVLTALTALGCGLIGGAFFAFSSFVMKALARLPDSQGIAAMQAINVEAVTPAFMTALFAPAVACIVLAVYSVVAWQEPGSAYLLVGSLLYLVGTIGVTIAANVPRNNTLEAVEPASGRGARTWREYVETWTVWNHVRTAAACAAAAALVLGLCV